MTQAMSKAYKARLKALKVRHALLDNRIDEAQAKPYNYGSYLSQLKKQRLMIREEIEVMSGLTKIQDIANAA